MTRGVGPGEATYARPVSTPVPPGQPRAVRPIDERPAQISTSVEALSAPPEQHPERKGRRELWIAGAVLAVLAALVGVVLWSPWDAGASSSGLGLTESSVQPLASGGSHVHSTSGVDLDLPAGWSDLPNRSGDLGAFLVSHGPSDDATRTAWERTLVPYRGRNFVILAIGPVDPATRLAALANVVAVAEPGTTVASLRVQVPAVLARAGSTDVRMSDAQVDGKPALRVSFNARFLPPAGSPVTVPEVQYYVPGLLRAMLLTVAVPGGDAGAVADRMAQTMRVG